LSKVALGENDPKTLITLNSLAVVYHIQGRYKDAEPIYKQCFDKQSAVLGFAHPDTLSTMQNLIAVQVLAGES
jgi:hypothetical protein